MVEFLIMYIWFDGLKRFQELWSFEEIEVFFTLVVIDGFAIPTCDTIVVALAAFDCDYW